MPLITHFSAYLPAKIEVQGMISYNGYYTSCATRNPMKGIKSLLISPMGKTLVPSI